MKYMEEQAMLQQIVDEESYLAYSAGNVTRNKELKILVLEQQSNIQNVFNILEQLECSQMAIENKAFNTINYGDTTLNCVKEGIMSLERLLTDITQKNALNSDLNSFRLVMKEILDAAHNANDMTRSLEHEVALQRDITDATKLQIELLAESIDRAGYYFEEY